MDEKSQFIEMFGDRNLGWKYNTIKLCQIAEFTTGGTPAQKESEKNRGDIPWITTVALGKTRITFNDAVAYISEQAISESATHLVPENSVMIGIRVGVGKSSVTDVAMCTSQDVLSVYNISSNYDLIYIKKVLDLYEDYFELNKRGATIKGITSEVVKKVNIPCAPLVIQKQFAYFIEQVDKSKFATHYKFIEAISTVNFLIHELAGGNTMGGRSDVFRKRF